MTQMDIVGTRVDVDPSLRSHVEAYGRLVRLAMAAADGEATRDPRGVFVFDGLEGAGEALTPEHCADGVVAREQDGTTYSYRVFDDHGNALPVRQVLGGSAVARDALGLALAPGINGIRARLTIRGVDGSESAAVSTGSQHDWQRLY